MIEIFKSGDWVTWVYEPKDPNGPYNYHIRKYYFHNGERDPIEDRLLRYDPPPYLVERVLFVDPEYLDGAGHPQIVGVWMTLKPKYGEMETKLRHFSGKLLKKASPLDNNR